MDRDRTAALHDAVRFTSALRDLHEVMDDAYCATTPASLIALAEAVRGLRQETVRMHERAATESGRQGEFYQALETLAVALGTHFGLAVTG